MEIQLTFQLAYYRRKSKVSLVKGKFQPANPQVQLTLNSNKQKLSQGLNFVIQSMKMIISSLKGSPHREKKQSSTQKQDSLSFKTPIKQFMLRKSVDSTAIQYIHTSQDSQNISKQRKSTTDIRIIPQQPKDAFQKKCFGNRRSIRLINELHKLYQEKPISKSQYKFKANRSFSQHGIKRSNSYAAFHKKGAKDRLPVNILAFDGFSKKNPAHKSQIFDKLSHSKRIKYSIIGNAYDC